MMISSYLEEDLRTGEVVRICGSATLNGITRVLVLKDDGTFWAYMSQNEMLTTGEIGREINLPTNFTPQDVTAVMFEDVLAAGFTLTFI